jgi:cell division septation protein DedD
LDSHVKERIVGAAVLVALGVWLIPWVLNGPESLPAELSTPELQLPSTDSATPIRTETVDLTSRPAASARAPDSESLRESVSDDTVPAARTAPLAAAEPPDAAPAVAAQPALQTTTAGAAPSGWSVQVGAFGERANATQLAGRVADYGYRAQVSEFLSSGQSMHRVRVEGFATREQAEAASSSLSAHGIPARVVPAD